MSIEYYEKQIVECEKKYQGPFIGYISPRGHLIDFSILLGKRGHDNWRNPITPVFLRYISYVIMGESLEKYKNSNNNSYKLIYENNKYDGFDDFVIRGLSSFNYNIFDYDTFINMLHNISNEIKKIHSSRNEYDYLEYDMMNFFEKCYSKRDFFYSLGRVIKVHNESTVFAIYKNYFESNNMNYYEEKRFYHDYVIMTLMSYFKDIMVQYLRYDSIERALPLDDLHIINNLYDFSNGYTLSQNPSILTSCDNPNERFYNWLLMDWNIQVLPKMLWDESNKKFIQSEINAYHQTDKEKMLSEEIALIKKKVPKQDRNNFFRKY